MSKRKPEEPKAGAPEWMSTYGDMVTLILCFFVLLFAMSSIDVQKFTAMASALSNSPPSIIQGGGADGISELLGNGIMEMPMIDSRDTRNTEDVKTDSADYQKMASDFMTYFADNAMDDRLDLIPAEDSLTITFKDGILFDSGSAQIRPEGLVALDFIANEIMKYPGMNVEIYGHTDNLPISTAIFPDNWYLSSARAISVGHFFIDEKGFLPHQILAIGRGEYLPIAPNDTAVNRAKNRRVEITIRNPEDTGVSFY